MMEVSSPGKPTHRLVETTEMSSETSEEEQEDQESEDERRHEAGDSKVRTSKESAADLYRHGLTLSLIHI